MTSLLSAGEFLADLHVHSRFSRATSRELTLEALHTAAQLKGIRVVATGDATHPAWLAEIKERLVPAEPGLWRLDPRRSSEDDKSVPAACRAEVRFILAAEISLVYKKEGKTRKNHNLVYFPDLSSIQAFSRRLEKIGNIHADGRPILGLDARDLLSLTLDTCPEAFLVPAHIWTPWFSVLGAQSGFDSLEECFGDLAKEVFAVETGLSSDPPMNRRVSFLDRLRLISNSDAHSAENLGREANRFAGELSFLGLREALRGKGTTSFLGTVEFYPEEGKYHHDGHRHCGVRFEPRETMRHGGRCPRCGKMLTVGVLHRVEALADRPEVDPHGVEQEFQHLIPLADMLSEIYQTGKASRRVAEARRRVLETLGAELVVLRERPASEIRALGIPLLDEAILRMRRGEIEILPGCDGEYGKIRIFREQEREALCGQKALFPPSGETGRKRRSASPSFSGSLFEKNATTEAPLRHPPALSDEQRAILDSPARRLLITAGPGSGKTHVLTLRIARRIEQGVDAANILAVTFTQKAAEEMRSRLAALLGKRALLPWIATFHGFCLMLLREEEGAAGVHILHELDQETLVARAIHLAEGQGGSNALRLCRVRSWICAAKEAFLAPEEIFPRFHPEVSEGEVERFRRVYAHYQRLLDSQGLLDLEDLLFRVGRRLERDAAWCASCRSRFQEIFVDEYQDLNAAQYRILRSLAPAGAKEPALTVIGDPNQAIYGFRGSTPVYFRSFLQEEPEAEHGTLERNYRSHPEIVAAAGRLLGGEPAADGEVRKISGAAAPLRIRECRDEVEEARAIAREIRQAIGATGFHEAGAELLPQPETGPRGFRDFAVLTRTAELGEPIAREFARQGIPVQRADRREALLGGAARRLLSFLRVGLGLGGLEDFSAAAPFFSPRLPESRLAAFIEWSYCRNLRLAEALQAAERFPVSGLRPTDQRRLLQGIQALKAIQREAARRPPREALRFLLHHDGVRRAGEEAAISAARERFEELLSTDTPCSAEKILETLVLAADGDLYREAAQKVALMTLHAAKGLEFPVVFIAACEEGVLPWVDAASEEQRLEELRLLYVGITRAKEQVVLSWAKRRLIRGKRLERQPSPFLAYLGNVAIERGFASAPPTRATPRQRSLFGDF